MSNMGVVIAVLIGISVAFAAVLMLVAGGTAKPSPYEERPDA